MIKVIIADDILILREGLKAILEQDSEIEVIGLASNGKEAADLSEKISPNVVLMDMRMPDFDGEYGIRKIKANNCNVKILVLTTFDDEETISKAISSGADGYVLKEMDNNKIIQAVKSINIGVNVFGGNVYSSICRKYVALPYSGIGITDRERDIIVLIAQGYDNKGISQKLYLAEGTVRNNTSRLLEKLGLKDRTQLAVFAVKNNLA
jgi:DNA-binding NarL/FixJ family response regulator